MESMYPAENPPARIHVSENDSAFLSVKKAAPKTSPLYAEKTLEGTGSIHFFNTSIIPFSINDAKKMLKGSSKSVSKKANPKGIMR